MSATRTTGEGRRTAARARAGRTGAEPGATPDASAMAPGRAARRARTQPRNRPPRHRLLLACVGVVGLAMLAVLFVNAALSAGAFRQHDLEIQLILLSEQEEALARKVQVDEAPLTIEKRARKLGMVPAESPVFLDLGTGKILGEPVPAPSPTEEVGFDDELTAPQEQLSGTLITQTPQPVATATVTVSAEPATEAGSPAPEQASPQVTQPTATPSPQSTLTEENTQ